jgi:hypothetical protein
MIIPDLAMELFGSSGKLRCVQNPVKDLDAFSQIDGGKWCDDAGLESNAALQLLTAKAIVAACREDG